MVDTIAAWNVRGINNPKKQKIIQQWITNNRLNIVGLLEPRIQPANMKVVEDGLGLINWEYFSNVHHSSLCRILVGWNADKVGVAMVHSASQWLTCDVTTLEDGSKIRVSFVYGLNSPLGRKALWDYLEQQKTPNSTIPWAILGDFNAILSSSDRHGGDDQWHSHMDDFPSCIGNSELIHVQTTGLHFTWHNGQHANATILRRLDWAFGNQTLLMKWPLIRTTVQPRSISDHSPLLLGLYPSIPRRKARFKFINSWVNQEGYDEAVQAVWHSEVYGNPISRLTSKLRILKGALKNLHNRHTSHISSRVKQARDEWQKAQFELDTNPLDIEANGRERTACTNYNKLSDDEEAILRQRSRIQWLNLGDKNTAFFHRSLLHRRSRNVMHSLQKETGEETSNPEEMGIIAVDYFKNTLNHHGPYRYYEGPNIYNRAISSEQKEAMAGPIRGEEIREALFDIPDDKAPGPDGYNSCFFKSSWSIVGEDFMEAIRYFFTHLKLPKCIAATRIVLIPKKENPSNLSEYRPISCCTVIYKCISKIIANRIKSSLASVISRSQTAFLPGRNISDAIFLVQELMHNYHRKEGPSRCAIKVDLKKAFDSINWDFVLQALHSIDIHPRVINWIKACISSPWFTISINGEDHGFFGASRGLRQGDPLSPYLFVLAMEGLHGFLSDATRTPSFKHHWRCKDLEITHQCFADDLILFSHADQHSVKILKEALDKFTEASGLSINHSKSSVFVAGVDDEMQNRIISDLGIDKAESHPSYLGVPLITTRLKRSNCLQLVDRIRGRIKLWTVSILSYAGRLQLIKSVLFATQVYWSTKFILPASIVATIDSLLSAFLWHGASLSPKGAKVAWNTICYPKREGGLGIKSLRTWNRAAMMKHIWAILTDKDSLWVAWVHKYLIKGNPFWKISVPSSPSWTWRKILLAREYCRGDFRVHVGNGNHTSLWYDYWLPSGKRPVDILSHRILSSANIPWGATVADIIDNGRWIIPADNSRSNCLWSLLPSCPVQLGPDKVIWPHTASGIFSIASAWDLIRPRRNGNNIHRLLWHSMHIPRHSFVLWLASRRRLSTMDKIYIELDNRICKLCNQEAESHDHLFFQCRFSSQVWSTITMHDQNLWPPLPWSQLLEWASNEFRSSKLISHKIGPLILAATVYHIWQERNRRVFNNSARSVQTISLELFRQVRDKISNLGTQSSIPEATRSMWNLDDV